MNIMIKRIKLPGWIVIILLFSGIIFGVNRSIAQVSNEPSEPKGKVVESSAYSGLNIRTTTKESERYTQSVSQPASHIQRMKRSMHL